MIHQRRAAHPRRRADQREREEVRLRRSPRAARRRQGARVARGPRAGATAPRSRTLDRRGLPSDRASYDDVRGAAGGRRTRIRWALRAVRWGVPTPWAMTPRATALPATGATRRRRRARRAYRGARSAPPHRGRLCDARRGMDAASRLGASGPVASTRRRASFQLPNWTRLSHQPRRGGAGSCSTPSRRSIESRR